MISNNARTVLEKRYFTKGPDGAINENWTQMAQRVGSFLASAEQFAELQVSYGAKFTELIHSLRFLPNSPTLANANARTGQLSACFVLPVPDDLGGIFETIKHAALIHQTGGGTGFAFSRLRPKNDFVGGNQGVSSGPVSFMDVFNAATESIKQGGLRRGANMGILRVDHPDIREFMAHKEDLAKLTNFNISVAITEAFMAAYTDGLAYDLINPRTGEVVGQLQAREVFDELITRAWRTGEPGIVFIDRMNEYCPVPWLGTYEATNPCGEQPLIPYESCNLGSLNLEKYVTEEFNVQSFAGRRPVINWDLLKEDVILATRLLDNVIDKNKYPLPDIAWVTQATRKIGLGVMGFASALYKLGVGYGSEKSFRLAEEFMSFIDYWSKRASIDLAREKGQFPARWGYELVSNELFRWQFMDRDACPNKHPSVCFMDLMPDLEKYGIRNSTTTTIAPTGTISIVADASSGCEPVFALAFKRWQADTHMTEVNPILVEKLKEQFEGQYLTNVIEDIAQHGGSLDHALRMHTLWHEDESKAEFLRKLRDVFVTAHDVTVEEHVLMQAAFQKYNDSATSKTINFPEHATVEDVREAYLLAYSMGCKGITIYRNNSRAAQPLSTGPLKAEPAPCCDHPLLEHIEGCTTCLNCNTSFCTIS